MTVRTGFASANMTRIDGRIAIRPVGSYVLDGDDGLPYIVTTVPVIGSPSADGEITFDAVPSDSSAWRTDGPVPYRVTEYVYGARRSYIVHVLDDGSGVYDLVTGPKYPVPDAPGPPYPVVKGAGSGAVRTEHMIEVIGRYSDCAGRRAEGAVIFRPMQPTEHGGSTPVVVTRAPVVETLLVDGAFSTVLLPSDDPDWMVLEPVAYRIMEAVGGTSVSWCALLTGAGPVDIADLRTGAPCTGTVTGRR